MGLIYVANVALWERLLSLKDIKDRCVSTSLPQTKRTHEEIAMPNIIPIVKINNITTIIN